MIKVEHINSFLEILKITNYASSLLGKETYEDSLLIKALKSIGAISTDALKTELDCNLYLLDQDTRVVYVKNTLRKFLTICPYYDIDGDIGLNTFHPLFNIEHIKHIDLSLKCIQNDNNWLQPPLYNKIPTAERFIILACFKLRCFVTDLEASLLAFGLFLDDIQESVGVYLSRNTRDGYQLALAGLSIADIENLLPVIEAETVISLDTIKTLRNCFDSIIWEKEQITDEEFAEYWKPGVKKKYLPLLDKKISTFLYLYFEYLNKENGFKTFKIKHSVTESTFNIKDVIRKKSKINKNTADCRYVKKMIGSSLL